jgi:hypothetical protein
VIAASPRPRLIAAGFSVVRAGLGTARQWRDGWCGHHVIESH